MPATESGAKWALVLRFAWLNYRAISLSHHSLHRRTYIQFQFPHRVRHPEVATILLVCLNAGLFCYLLVWRVHRSAHFSSTETDTGSIGNDNKGDQRVLKTACYRQPRAWLDCDWIRVSNVIISLASLPRTVGVAEHGQRETRVSFPLSDTRDNLSSTLLGLCVAVCLGHCFTTVQEAFAIFCLTRGQYDLGSGILMHWWDCKKE